jgi:hypothetical protein
LFGWLAFWTLLLVVLPVGGVAARFMAAVAAALAAQGLTFRVLGGAMAGVGSSARSFPGRRIRVAGAS